MLEPRDGGALIRDPLTNRVFRFDELQAGVLLQLDGKHNPRAIAEDIFGDADAEPDIKQLLDRLKRLMLLGHVDPDPSEAARAQASELRARAAVERDRGVAATVRWAAEKIPMYRKRIGDLARGVHGVRDLATLPTTTKKDVRDQFPHGLIARGSSFNELLEQGLIHVVTSSGSTGDRLQAISSAGERESYNLFVRHPAMRSAGHPETLKLALFTTPICSGAICHLESPYEERVVDDGLVLVLRSSERIMRLRRTTLEEIVDDFRRFSPDVLQVDPVYAVALVRALQREGLEIPKVSAVFSTYEFMSCLHREILAEAFGIPIHQLYGASEIGGIAAFTCENGRFHVDEHYVFEFLNGGKPVPFNEWGEITATMLTRDYSRLIRYRLGDLGTPIRECACPFSDLPAFEIEGRIQDIVFTTAGKPISTRQIDRLFEGLRWIDFYQFLQRDRSRYELLGVPREDVDAAQDERVFSDRARALLGADAEVRIGYGRDLPLTASLKYPPTVNRSSRAWRPND